MAFEFFFFVYSHCCGGLSLFITICLVSLCLCFLSDAFLYLFFSPASLLIWDSTKMVEVSLDDLIAQHKKQNRSGTYFTQSTYIGVYSFLLGNNRGAFRGFGRFRGRGRRFINRRSTPYFASGLTVKAFDNINSFRPLPYIPITK
jgi:hypothetical protein